MFFLRARVVYIFVTIGSTVQNQTTSVNGNSKILRLFGVNLECQPDNESEPSTPDGSSMSSHGPAHHQFYPPAYYSDHMVSQLLLSY